MTFYFAQSEVDATNVAEKFDKFLGKRFVFKVQVKAFTRTMDPSFTVQRMTDDKTIIARLTPSNSVNKLYS